MDLATATRGPKPGQTPRTHAPAADGDVAACGATVTVTATDQPAEAVTCQACRVHLHRVGALPYIRRPRA